MSKEQYINNVTRADCLRAFMVLRQEITALEKTTQSDNLTSKDKSMLTNVKESLERVCEKLFYDLMQIKE